MLNRKTLTVLVSGVVGAVALLVFAPDRDAGRASPPDVVTAKSANSDGTPASGPMIPGEGLRNRALREGIGSVRNEFRKHVQKPLQQLTSSGEERVIPSWKRTAHNAYVSALPRMYAEFWADAEARALHRGTPIPDDFDEAIWKPMFEAAVKHRAARVEHLGELERLRDAGFPGEEDENELQEFFRVRKLPELEQSALREQFYRSGEGSFKQQISRATIAVQQRDGIFLNLAELAKIAKRPDLVEQVYMAYKNPLPKRILKTSHNIHDPSITHSYLLQDGELATAEEFLAHDHRGVFEKKYGVPPPPRLEPVPPKSKFPVTENEQKAIKDLLQELGDAIVAQDHEKLLSLHTGDMEKTRQLMREELASIKLYSFDMSQAQVEFVRDEENGPVRVEVNDFIIDREIAGKREKATSVNLYTVVFIDGRPKLRMFEE